MKKTRGQENHGEIVIYKNGRNKVVLEAHLQKESIWLNLDQMAGLFGRDKSVISRHIKNVFEEKELSSRSTVANFATVQTEGGRTISRNIEYFNLDVIISVGYRVKSHNGVRFRIWATKVLKNHLVKGYTLNKKRLGELKGEELKVFEDTLSLMRQTMASRSLSSKEESGLLQVITEYAYTWVLLQKYDKNELAAPKSMQISAYALDYPEACEFLSRNNYLLRKNGEKKINDNALVAIVLLLAESKPNHKDVMIRLIMHFLVGRLEDK